MKNAIVFCPYFGKLPSYFGLWLESCKINNHIKFVVFTDDNQKYDLPINVEIVNIEFNVFVRKIQSKFDFKITLKTPYKFCDFKPAYGYLFSEYIEGFEYWGSCDLDVIWGDIMKFIPKKNYDKINYSAHLSFYRNDEIINNAFMKDFFCFGYKDIFFSSEHLAYDEDEKYGINNILLEKGCDIYNFCLHVADIRVERNNLQFAEKYKNNVPLKYNKKRKIFAYEDGKIYCYYIVNNNIIKKEFAYIHLQKRRILNKIDGISSRFLITAHSLIPYQVPTIDLIKDTQVSCFYVDYIRIKFKALLMKIKRKVQVIKWKIKVVMNLG